jgi:hypothetical protein
VVPEHYRVLLRTLNTLSRRAVTRAIPPHVQERNLTNDGAKEVRPHGQHVAHEQPSIAPALNHSIATWLSHMRYSPVAWPTIYSGIA